MKGRCRVFRDPGGKEAGDESPQSTSTSSSSSSSSSSSCRACRPWRCNISVSRRRRRRRRGERGRRRRHHHHLFRLCRCPCGPGDDNLLRPRWHSVDAGRSRRRTGSVDRRVVERRRIRRRREHNQAPQGFRHLLSKTSAANLACPVAWAGGKEGDRRGFF